MEKKPFIVHATNDKIWNLVELIEFLSDRQGKDINLVINPEAICLESIGLYKLLNCFQFSSVNIKTENTLESHPVYNINNTWKNKWLAHIPVIPTELHTWSGNKKFLAFYHRPTASRLGLASYLFAHYKNQSTIHFSYDTDIDKLQLFEFDKLASLRTESLSDVSAMLPHMPLYAYENYDLDEITKRYDYSYSRDPGITMYRDILVDIISEAHVIGNTFYPTEKTARAIWLKKPFLMFASRNYLDYLHQMGFLTFNDFWSEDYDGYEHRDRYLKILEVIDTLAQMSTEELISMYQHMQYILDHNYNLLVSQSYNTKITQII